MRTNASPRQLEARRLIACKLLKNGWRASEVAKRLKVTPKSVQRWEKAARDGGSQALKARPNTGRPRKFTKKKWNRFLAMLKAGPRARGYPSDAWTRKYVKQAIHDHLSVTYQNDQVRRLLHDAGWGSMLRPKTQKEDRSKWAWRAIAPPTKKKITFRPEGYAPKPKKMQVSTHETLFRR